MIPAGHARQRRSYVDRSQTKAGLTGFGCGVGCSLRAELPAWEPRVPESIGPTPAFTLLWNNKTFWEHGNLIYCADGNNNSIFVYLLPPYLPSSQDTSMTLALRVCVCADNTGPPVCVCVRVDNTGPAWSGGRRLQGHGPGDVRGNHRCLNLPNSSSGKKKTQQARCPLHLPSALAHSCPRK